MSMLEKHAMTFNDAPHSEPPKSDARGAAREQQHGDQHDDRQENAAKYRRKVDELNRSRDSDIERALLRASR
jgi:hypothetical protein